MNIFVKSAMIKKKEKSMNQKATDEKIWERIKKPKQNILLLGVGVDQIPAIEKAKKLNLGVYGFDGNSEAAGKDKLDRFVHVDIKDIDAVEKAARKLNKEVGIDGVMAPAVDIGPSVGRVVDALGLLGVGEKTALNMTDKILRRVALDEFKIPSPRWGYREEKKAGEWNIWPSVVKPRDKSAAEGVHLAKNIREVGLNYDYLEEYLEGWEISTEVIVFQNGTFLAINADRNYDKKHKWPPYLIEDGCSLPSKLPAQMVIKINILISKLIEKFRISNCVMKLDLLIKDNIVYVLECPPRLGGGKLSSFMIEKSLGIDWWTLAIKVAMGIPITESDSKVKKQLWCVQRHKFPEVVKSHRDRLFSVEETGTTYEEALKKAEDKVK
jgi:predicted ATP-grasp superfamily ATP-dependent carboligase